MVKINRINDDAKKGCINITSYDNNDTKGNVVILFFSFAES